MLSPFFFLNYCIFNSKPPASAANARCLARMAGLQNAPFQPSHKSNIYSVEESGRGAHPRVWLPIKAAGQITQGAIMKAIVVAVLNALSSAPVAAKDGQRRGKAR